MSDLASEWDRLTPKTSLADDWDAIKPDAKKQETVKAVSSEKPGKIMSALAGAGEATGRTAMAVQQLAGKGVSFLGDKTGIEPVQKAGWWLEKDAMQGAKKLAAENAPYQEANPISNFAGEVAGLVASPINKIIPGGAPATTLVGAGVKGAAQGAALNALTTPVTDEKSSFINEKMKQFGIGGVGGTAGGIVGHGLSKALNAGVEKISSMFNKATAGDTAAAADGLVAKTIADQGMDPAVVKATKPELFSVLQSQVQDAIKSGKQVDPEALTRLTQAQTLPVPVPMLKGQITRDPMQFSKEQNLRGIHGVGEPITETLSAQNKALIANLDAMGAKGGDIVDTGKVAIDALKSADKKASQSVTNAYNAFKASTGKELDVPLGGLAQDYAATVKEFGDAIPGAIRSRFEGLGLVSGTQKQVLTIGEAEGLIKQINRNYDPKNTVAARALDDLRKGVQKAISEGAGSAEGGAAADLAKAARAAAKDRFELIDSIPALKGALRGDQPDKFLQKYVLQGNKEEIKSLMGLLSKESPEAVEKLRDSVLTLIKDRTLNGNSEGNAVFSQSQLKRFVTDKNTSARMTEVLGPEKMAQLRQLNDVAENASYAPAASAVNRSNTASAAANLVKSEVQGGAYNKLLDVMRGSKLPFAEPGANYLQKQHQGNLASGLIEEATNPSLAKQSGLRLLPSLVNPSARAGSAALQEKSRRTAR